MLSMYKWGEFDVLGATLAWYTVDVQPKRPYMAQFGNDCISGQQRTDHYTTYLQQDKVTHVKVKITF